MDLHPNIRSTDSRVSHPELYTAPHREAAEDEVSQFLGSLVKLVKPDWVLEVGTSLGHTALHLGAALQDNGVGRLDTIDVNKRRLEEARERLEGLPVNIHAMKYQEFTPPDNRFYGVAFFDSEWKNRDGELKHFRPWLTHTSILVFHDTGSQNPGSSGIAKLEMEGIVRSIFLPTPRGLCLATLV